MQEKNAHPVDFHKSKTKFWIPSNSRVHTSRKWFNNNYSTLKAMNNSMSILLRCHDNAIPAVATELTFTQHDVFQYMLDKKLFRNEDGSISIEREEAAKQWLKTDFKAIRYERWACKGFDPMHPLIDDKDPNWRLDPVKAEPLAKFIELHDGATKAMEMAKSGPYEEYEKAQNSLLCWQRVDLWCAGEAEVDRAVQHLAALGRKCNNYEADHHEFITEFYPGSKSFDWV